MYSIPSSKITLNQQPFCDSSRDWWTSETFITLGSENRNQPSEGLRFWLGRPRRTSPAPERHKYSSKITKFRQHVEPIQEQVDDCSASPHRIIAGVGFCCSHLFGTRTSTGLVLTVFPISQQHTAWCPHMVLILLHIVVGCRALRWCGKSAIPTKNWRNPKPEAEAQVGVTFTIGFRMICCHGSVQFRCHYHLPAGVEPTGELASQPFSPYPMQCRVLLH